MEKKDMLIRPENTAAFLKRMGIDAKKRFGQNFLVDPVVLERIIEGSGITKEDTVLEIGPGIGSMTQALCMAAGNVVAVEIDKSLIPVLEETLGSFDNVKIINEDILKLDITEATCGKPFRVAANLPYYITTPILMRLLESKTAVKSITVMVQKEVADRMTAGPGGKEYGALSLAVQYYSSPRVIAKVPSCCFIPRPGVDSAVVHLEIHDDPPVKPADGEYMFTLIRAAFSKRRKTLINSLSGSPDTDAAREDVREALGLLGLREDIRGERLSLGDFSALSDILSEKRKGK